MKKYIVLEEYRKGGSDAWDKSFDSHEEAKAAIEKEIGEDYLEYYDFYDNSYCGTEIQYIISEIEI